LVCYFSLFGRNLIYNEDILTLEMVSSMQKSSRHMNASSLQKSSYLLFLIIILSSTVAFSLFKIKTDALGEKIHVANSPESIIIVPDNYPTIQKAINNASDGDVIYVRANVYYEKVVINKPNLIIIGESKEHTIIDGNGSGPIIEITAKNVTFTGFTLRRSSTFGAEILNYANFSFNIVLQCHVGVDVSSRSLVTHNFISDCSNGVSLHSCSEVIVRENNFTRNIDGVILSSGSYNYVLNNTITKSVTGGHGITILSSSFNNLICSNLIWNNSHGIWLSGNSSCNVIANNTIAKNSILGIELTDAPNNMIYHNNFINNKKQVTTNTINTWDNGYPSGGNYWSDYKNKISNAEDNYKGEEQSIPGSDGVWDQPYIIDANNTDRYPLVKPYGKIPDFTPPVTMDDYDGLWHNQDFIIRFNASDNLSGVAETYYMINSGPTQMISVDGYPLICIEGDNNTIEYWSVDWCGNEENHHTVTGIKLDKTKPIVSCGGNRTVKVGELLTFNATGSKDLLSGIVSYKWNLGDGTIKNGMIIVHNYTKPGSYRITLTVRDAAGNLNTDTVTVKVIQNSELNSLRIIIPVSALIIFGAVTLSVIYKFKRRKLHRRKIKN